MVFAYTDSDIVREVREAKDLSIFFLLYYDNNILNVNCYSHLINLSIAFNRLEFFQEKVKVYRTRTCILEKLCSSPRGPSDNCR